MVLTDKVLADLLESKAKTANAPTILEKQYIKEQLTILQENYGIDIKPFKETWYPSFSGNLNIVFLIRNNHYFRLSYNPNNSPDTLLLDRKSNKYILSYNFQKGMKFSFSTENNVRKVQLNMYLNPYKLKVWSSALLLYPEATDMKSFQLAESLKLNDYFRGDDQNIDYIRQGENFFIIGKQFNRFTFRYSGNIPNQNQGLGDLKTKLDDRFGELDEYVILDNANRFYPNPGDQFFQSTLKISIPEELNCLASGFLHKKRKFFNRYEYLFKSEGTKGLTIVCGNFKPLTTIKAKSPITIFGGEGLKMRNYLKKQELKEMVNFLLSKYKKREIESLNILLRRWKEPGGISYKGFVVFNILKHRRTDVTTTRLTESMYKYSPVYLTKDINRDNLIHELAHQWWGGIISWKSYRDIWITEGGAQFSTLLYLENKLGKRLFNRIKRRIIKNIKRDSESGPLIYGTRIDNITKDYFAFQSIIYNKGAMVFMMLRDMLGEKGLLRRVNRIFTKFDKKSLTTKQFIRAFCKEKKGKAYLEKFFTNWIYFREIPQVSYSVHIADKLATIKVDQKNTDFVFPLKILVKMKGEDAEDVLIVTEKSQTFAIKKKTRIKRIRVDAGFSPIDLKEKRDG